MSGHRQPFAASVDTLVMQRIGTDFGSAEHGRETAVTFQRDFVHRIISILEALSVQQSGSRKIGQILIQGSSKRRIQKLHSAADSQQRFLCLNGVEDHFCPDFIFYEVNSSQQRVRFLAVKMRVHICAARK